MNKNFPHAVRVIRTALASGNNDPAAAIAQALMEARLLVDPERSYGAVLHRTAAGGWSREPQRQPLPKRELTDLEQQALAWDKSCERAQLVAASIRTAIGEHPAFKEIRVDGDRVLVSLQITGQEQWAEWRRYFGITPGAERPLSHAVGGEGYRDGVRVSVMAYDVPQVQARAAQAAKSPFLLDGIVYDLALPQRDAHGVVWYFQGDQRPDDGMPLLSMDGRPERCSLQKIVENVGPLTAVRTPVTPVAAAEGGEGK